MKKKQTKNLILKNLITSSLAIMIGASFKLNHTHETASKFSMIYGSVFMIVFYFQLYWKLKGNKKSI